MQGLRIYEYSVAIERVEYRDEGLRIYEYSVAIERVEYRDEKLCC
jgi:hypothetical protein